MKNDEIQAWAVVAVAAMLRRVYGVCITEWQWKIDALKKC